MGNKATTIDQQIALLQSRGMVLDQPDHKVKEVLLDIGYYRLGFYWHPFEIDDQHNLKEGTKFSDVLSLYYLDADLRNLLLKYIKRIEIHFRTNIVYCVSNKYPNSPAWFVDRTVMVNHFINGFDNVYNDKFKTRNKTIQHHKNYINDRYAPAWKTLEYLTFGSILTIYKSLRDNNLKKSISNSYDIRSISKFENLINTIVYIRNECAHSGVIFDLNTPLGIAQIPGLSFTNRNRHSLDSSIKVITFILEKISINRKNDLETEVSRLLNQFTGNETLKNLIINKIGYSFGERAVPLRIRK